MANGPALALADVYRPHRILSGYLYTVILVVGGSLLIAASAQVAIHVPFTLIPITGQTFAVCLIGALLGARRGAAAVLSYLAEGAAGLPVFADGKAGPLVFIGETGGYLVGFVLGALIVGALAQRGWDRQPLTTALAIAFGESVILLCGAIWLIGFYGPGGAVTAGVVPFLPGAVVKVALATALLPLGWKVLHFFEGR